MGRSLVQRSPTKCRAPECDRGNSKRGPKLNGLSSHEKNIVLHDVFYNW
jgi:hypothetical protein